jgi:hypothetical protein
MEITHITINRYFIIKLGMTGKKWICILFFFFFFLFFFSFVFFCKRIVHYTVKPALRGHDLWDKEKVSL